MRGGSGGEACGSLGRQLGQRQAWGRGKGESGWVASKIVGAGPVEWLGGMVLSSCTLGTAGSRKNRQSCPRPPALLRDPAGHAGREGQEANSGSDEPGACPPNIGAPTGLPGAAATLEKGR